AKIISVIFTILCILIIRLYVNRMKQRDLYKKVNLEQLDKTYVKVKPQSFKHAFQMILTYLFFLYFASLSYVTYFSLDNIVLLLTGSIALLLSVLVVNSSIIERCTRMEFINK